MHQPNGHLRREEEGRESVWLCLWTYLKSIDPIYFCGWYQFIWWVFFLNDFNTKSTFSLNKCGFLWFNLFQPPKLNHIYSNFLRSMNKFSIIVHHWIIFSRDNWVIPLDTKWFHWVRIDCILFLAWWGWYGMYRIRNPALQTFPVRLLSNSCHFQILTMRFYCHWHEYDRSFNNMKFSGNFFGEIYCPLQGLDRGFINKGIFSWNRQDIPLLKKGNSFCPVFDRKFEFSHNF